MCIIIFRLVLSVWKWLPGILLTAHGVDSLGIVSLRSTAKDHIRLESVLWNLALRSMGVVEEKQNLHCIAPNASLWEFFQSSDVHSSTCKIQFSQISPQIYSEYSIIQ